MDTMQPETQTNDIQAAGAPSAPSDTPILKLQHAFMMYAAACVLLFFLLFGLFSLYSYSLIWLLFLIGYLAIGLTLNHLIFKRMVAGWHPMYDTLENVAADKIQSVVFWPLSQLVLLIQVAAHRHL